MPEPERPPVPPAPPPIHPDPDAILAQRARVMERLAGSTWHELAQPLHGLAGMASLLRAEPSAADQLGVEPDLVTDAVARLRRLGLAFTDLARGREPAAALRELVEDVLALAADDLVDVEVVNDIPSDAPEPGAGLPLQLVVASLVADVVDALGGPRTARGRMRWSQASGLRVVLEHDGRADPPADLELLAAIVAGGGGALRHEPLPRGGRFELDLKGVD